jgi:hypothetical protein
MLDRRCFHTWCVSPTADAKQRRSFFGGGTKARGWLLTPLFHLLMTAMLAE